MRFHDFSRCSIAAPGRDLQSSEKQLSGHGFSGLTDWCGSNRAGCVEEYRKLDLRGREVVALRPAPRIAKRPNGANSWAGCRLGGVHRPIARRRPTAPYAALRSSAPLGIVLRYPALTPSDTQQPTLANPAIRPHTARTMLAPIAYQDQFLPAALIIAATAVFFVYERVAPGRQLPESPGWYWRAGLMNLAQLGLIGLSGLTWNRYFREYALLPIGGWSNPVAEGAFYWLAGTFVFYWWHRLRHVDGFWHVFHQVHHSASRIEAATAFYKHPLEIAADSIIAGFFIYAVCGGTAEAGA